VKYLRFIALFCCMLPMANSGAAASSTFNPAKAGMIWGSALAFIAPRTLEPIPMPRMAVWGLGGLTALDPDLTVTFQAGRLVLYRPNRILYTAPAPLPQNAAAWGHACAAIAAHAFAASAALQRAGTEGVIRSFFDELFNHFDPYSRYEAPREATRDEAMRLGQDGVGLTLARIGRHVVISRVAPDSPADDAGIQQGSLVLSINRVPVSRYSPAALNKALTGPKGTAVIVTVRPHDNAPASFKLIYSHVPAQTVFGLMRGPLAAIQITGFDRDTAAQFASMLAGLMAAKPEPQGIVIDLRGNRGGFLRQAVLTADTLLGQGTIIRTIGRDAAADKIWHAEGADLAQGLPVVVLVDGQTASAAEVFSAALADNGRAVVVGSSTLGKGLVQNVTTLPGGGELFVTWSRMIAPLGWPLQGLGVLPQICTSLGSDAVLQQLAALEAGHNLLAKPLREARSARAPMPLPEVLAIRDSCPAVVGGNGDFHAAQTLVNDSFAYRSALIPHIIKPAAHARLTVSGA
jgi:carboxyl-terminal processing protease